MVLSSFSVTLPHIINILRTVVTRVSYTSYTDQLGLGLGLGLGSGLGVPGLGYRRLIHVICRPRELCSRVFWALFLYHELPILFSARFLFGGTRKLGLARIRIRVRLGCSVW